MLANHEITNNKLLNHRGDQMNGYMFLLGSSVGKKILMAVTGLCMVGFLAVHLLGNSMAFAGAKAFNGYAAKLH